MRSQFVVTVSLAGLLGGCTFTAEPPPTYHCSAASPGCPEGYQCVVAQQTCVKKGTPLPEAGVDLRGAEAGLDLASTDRRLTDGKPDAGKVDLRKDGTSKVDLRKDGTSKPDLKPDLKIDAPKPDLLPTCSPPASCLDGNKCAPNKQVACDPSNSNPPNSTDTTSNVTVACQASGGFAPPAACGWSCNASYCKEGASCLQSKLVACDPNNGSPPNSTDTAGNVTVGCQASGAFAPPAACGWSCNASYCKDGASCLQSKVVACDPNNGSPPNSTDTSGNVTITCQASGAFTAPALCAWTCNAGYLKVGNTCVRPLYLVSAGPAQGVVGGTRATMNSRCASAVNASYSGLGTSASVGFISISSSDQIAGLPATQGVPTGRPILGPGGAVIADSWADLLDGSIKISLETAGVTSNYWFSGSLSTGAVANSTCSGWSVIGGNDGQYGTPTATDATWIATHYSGYCGGSYHYLCLTWTP